MRFFCSGADDLLNLDLKFPLDILFSKEYYFFDSINLRVTFKIKGASEDLPVIPSRRRLSISSSMPYFFDAV